MAHPLFRILGAAGHVGMVGETAGWGGEGGWRGATKKPHMHGEEKLVPV